MMIHCSIDCSKMLTLLSSKKEEGNYGMSDSRSASKSSKQDTKADIKA